MKSWSRLLLLAAWAMLGLGGQTALAGGVLVRLDAARLLDGDVYVELRPPEGETERVQLQDDGQQPDVTAGDGLWAGAVFLPQTDVEVFLVLDGERLEGGPVQWSAADIPRDLDLNLRAGVLKASAREANTHGDGGRNGAPGPGGGPANRTADTEPDPAAMWFIGGGALLLLVMGVVALSVRTRSRYQRGDLTGVALHRPGGFAGPNSPSLDDGLIYWSVADPKPHAVAHTLVRMLARHHNVLVVAPSPESLPASLGQSVFATSHAAPRKVGDALEAVHRMPRAAGVVVFWGVAGSDVVWADRDDELPLGTGGIVLCGPEHTEPAPSHTVRVAGPGALQVEAVDGTDRFMVFDRSA
jgi:hypothetical protein